MRVVSRARVYRMYRMYSSARARVRVAACTPGGASPAATARCAAHMHVYMRGTYVDSPLLHGRPCCGLPDVPGAPAQARPPAAAGSCSCCGPATLACDCWPHPHPTHTNPSHRRSAASTRPPSARPWRAAPATHAARTGLRACCLPARLPAACRAWAASRQSPATSWSRSWRAAHITCRDMRGRRPTGHSRDGGSQLLLSPQPRCQAACFKAPL